jgi:hypothetical protein
MKGVASIGERFPWRPGYSNVSDHLCERCGALNLGTFSDLKEENERGTIAFIERASIRRGCGLCTQFGRIFAWARTIRNESSGHDSFTLDYRRLHTEQWRDFYVRVRFMEFSQILDFDFDFYPTTPDCQDKAWVPMIKTMLSNSADLNLAKQWLSVCQSSHASCQRLQACSQTLRVIDCRNRTLCLVDSSESYACLSYVWGDRLTNEQGDLASTLHQTPQTIEDAMSVTLSLGMFYLWVDRYCIDQRDLHEKHDIIRNMDRIYQGAEVTIIAPTGRNPQYGLPGVGNTSRRPQLSLLAGDHAFLSTENVREQIHASVWNSRGWTYQEMLMSRRRLVFTDSQMYFQCACAIWLESLDMAATESQSHLHEQFRVFPTIGANNDFDEIQARLKEYYQRHLSYRTDAIHAFSGICNMQRTDAGPVALTHFYGIPIAFPGIEHRTSEVFIEALTWRILHRDSVVEPLAFPLLFPSWSWASVKARSSGSNNEGEYMKPYRFCTDQVGLEISLMSKQGYQIGLDKVLRSQVRTDYTNFEPVLHIVGYILRGCFSRSTAEIAGALQLDSRNEPDFANVVALLLGVAQEASTEKSRGATKRYRFHHLLLVPLTPEQLFRSKFNPNEQRCFRRIGVWTQTMTAAAVVGDECNNTSEFLGALFVEEMPDDEGAWAWSRETFYLL